MDDTEFDKALVAAAFNLAVLRGWGRVTVAAAAREAGLDLGRARVRAPGTGVLLMRFGQALDTAALGAASSHGTAREKLFDMLMGRFDALQAQRDGVLALFASLPYQPALGLALAAGTRRSMGWLVDAAELDVSGLKREAVIQGMVGIWLYALRAWEKDTSPDLSATMAAVDRALDRVAGVSQRMGFTAGPEEAPGVAAGEAPARMPEDTQAEANMDRAAQVDSNPGEPARDAAKAFRDDTPPAA